MIYKHANIINLFWNSAVSWQVGKWGHRPQCCPHCSVFALAQPTSASLTCFLPLLLNSSSADTSLINFCGNRSESYHDSNLTTHRRSRFHCSIQRSRALSASPFLSFRVINHYPRSADLPTRKYASPQLRRTCLDSGYVLLLWDSCSQKRVLLWLARPFSVPCFGSCRVAWLSCHMCFTKTMSHARQRTVWTLRLMAPLSAERNNTHVLDLHAVYLCFQDPLTN